MQRYFFDIINGHPTKDMVGSNCPDDDAARRAGAQILCEVALDEIHGGRTELELRVTVRKESGRLTQLVARLSEEP